MEWGELQSAIMTVSEISWVAFVFLLLVHLTKTAPDRSDTISLTVWCVADLASTACSPTLYKYVASGAFDYSTWYLSFVLLNCAAIGLIKIAHDKLGLFMTKFTVSIIGLLLVMSFLHTLRMLDWLYVNLTPQSQIVEAFKNYQTGWLADLYRYGLMATKLFAIYLIANQMRLTQRSSV